MLIQVHKFLNITIYKFFAAHENEHINKSLKNFQNEKTFSKNKLKFLYG